ncbi:MAG TPA: CYTH domain-containing protein, partial [Roseiflexaceae bacterium]|nr:CYTH domain-containing protein [Roseiflexaceae bacterium]
MKEIEAKFRVDQRAMFVEFLRTTKLGPYTLIPTPGIEFQHNTYFDTSDLQLSARHCSLRVREVKSR